MLEFSAIRDAEDNTWLNYISAMSHYTTFTGKTPEQLIDDAKKEIKQGLLMDEREIFKYIPNFRNYLRKQENPFTGNPLSESTVKKYVGIIVTFYKAFQIQTPEMPKKKKRKGKVTKVNDTRILTNEDGKIYIRHALQYANPRDRAIILCGISSGMGAAEISSLTVKSFYEGREFDKRKTGITCFDLQRQKNDNDFITFITPEATDAIKAYLKWRDRPSEPNDDRERRKVTPNSYLFISSKVKEVYLKTGNEEKRKLTARAICNVYDRISTSATISTPRGHYNTFRSHNMRKFFTSMLKNKGCDSDMVEFFCGHTLGETKDAYFLGIKEDLFEIYKDFYPFLTIEKIFDLGTDDIYQGMLDKLHKVEAEKEILQLGNDEYQRMRKKVEYYEKVYGDRENRKLRLAEHDAEMKKRKEGV